jgi:hypothetical protein
MAAAEESGEREQIGDLEFRARCAACAGTLLALVG